MEKIKEHYSKEYPVLRLYKDDINKLIELFNANVAEFKLEINDYKLDNISEINKIEKKESTYFKISSYDPHFGVEFSKSSARLYASDISDLKQAGLIANIDKLLIKRRSYLDFIISNWMQVPFQIAIWLTVWIFPFKKYFWQGMILLMPFILLYVSWFRISYLITFKRHCVIYLQEDSASYSFLSRKKDDILLALISAILGGIVTLLILFLTKIIG